MTKRDAVCEAALELFAEKGIQATTTREIAERAGAAEGTLYRHFDGKADLASRLYERCTGELRDRLAAAVEETGTPGDRLEALVRGIFVFFAEKPTSCTYLLSTQDKSTDRTDPQASPAPLAAFIDIIDEGIETGAFGDISAPLVAGWILSMVQRTVLFLKADALTMNRQEAIDRTVAAARGLARAEGT